MRVAAICWVSLCLYLPIRNSGACSHRGCDRQVRLHWVRNRGAREGCHSKHEDLRPWGAVRADALETASPRCCHRCARARFCGEVGGNRRAATAPGICVAAKLSLSQTQKTARGFLRRLKRRRVKVTTKRGPRPRRGQRMRKLPPQMKSSRTRRRRRPTTTSRTMKTSAEQRRDL